MEDEKPETPNLVTAILQNTERKLAAVKRKLAVEKEKVAQRDQALHDARDAIQQAREKLAQLEESRGLALREKDAIQRAARNVSKELETAVAARERYKRERDDLTMLLRQASEKIRELIEDKG